MELRTTIAVLVVLALPACTRSDPAPFVSFEPEARKIADGARDPSLYVPASGKVHALVAEAAGNGGHGVSLRLSHDEGDSFADRIPVSQRLETAESHGESSPLLLVGRAMDLVALWEAQDEDGKVLYQARSTDFGKTFSEPVVIEGSTGHGFAFFHAAIAPDDTIVVAWLAYGDPDTPPGTATLEVSTSHDHGRTLSPPEVVSRSVCPCCRPVVVASEDLRAVAWRSVGDENVRDVAVATSRDRGATWSDPVMAADDGWKVSGCPHSGPALALAGDRLVVAWTTAASGSYEAFWSHSTDGKTFAPKELLAGEIRDANHPALTVVLGEVFAAFQGRDPEARQGWSPSRIYLRRLLPGTGEAAVALPRSPGSAVYPKIHSLGAGRLLVAWTDSSEAGSSVWAARGRLPDTR